MGVTLYDLKSESGLKKLDKHLVTHRYISGSKPSTDDLTIYAALPLKIPPCELMYVATWYKHIDALLGHPVFGKGSADITVKFSLGTEEPADTKVDDSGLGSYNVDCNPDDELKASSFAASSNTKVSEHFISIGFPQELVFEVINEYGEEKVDKLLEVLLTKYPKVLGTSFLIVLEKEFGRISKEIETQVLSFTNNLDSSHKEVVSLKQEKSDLEYRLITENEKAAKESEKAVSLKQEKSDLEYRLITENEKATKESEKAASLEQEKTDLAGRLRKESEKAASLKQEKSDLELEYRLRKESEKAASLKQEKSDLELEYRLRKESEKVASLELEKSDLKNRLTKESEKAASLEQEKSDLKNRLTKESEKAAKESEKKVANITQDRNRLMEEINQLKWGTMELKQSKEKEMEAAINQLKSHVQNLMKLNGDLEKTISKSRRSCCGRFC